MATAAASAFPAMLGLALPALLALGVCAGGAAGFPSQLDEGDRCAAGAGPGECRRISACLPALDAVRRRARSPPRRCGFVGFEEVVCCPLDAAPPPPPPPPPPGRPRPQRPGRRPWRPELEEPAPIPPQRPQPTPRPQPATPARRPTTTARPPPPSGRNSVSQQACASYRRREEQRIGWFILGGEEVEEGEFPHMAALGYLRQGQSSISWRCGGTLISERYVLTAAHCLTDRYAGVPKLVRLGEVDLRAAAGGPGDYAVERAVLHPRYKRKFNYDDVALLRLAAPVAFSQNVSPACLPLANGEPPRGALLATGWGATEAYGSSPSPVLLKTNVSAVPLEQCRDLHRTSSRIPEGISADMLCAGDPRGIADTCVGDSGGPLQLQEQPRSSVYTVVGVTSFGPDPCGGRKPGVYVRVSSYVPWIESIVWG